MAEARIPIELSPELRNVLVGLQNAIQELRHASQPQVLYCLTCIGERIHFLDEQMEGKHPEDDPGPELNEAITFAPAWQTQTMLMQQFMACVAVPSCMKHLSAKERSPEEQALLGGKLLPGKMGQVN